MVNKVLLIGRVGKDAEIKQTNSTKLMKFSLATSESYKKNEEWINVVEWHNIVMFSDYVDNLANRIKKGATVFVEGKIKTNEHEGKYYTSIVAKSVKVLQKNEAEQVTKAQNMASKLTQQGNDDDDLPF